MLDYFAVEARADHPLMRGENRRYVAYISSSQGSPPHARGKLDDDFLVGDARRITPACAGKTKRTELSPITSADHPRMRGEDALLIVAAPPP